MKRLLHFRQWPLRTQARVLVCTLLLTMAAAFGHLWGARVAAQIEDETGAQLLQMARHMADRLSNEMAARVRDVRLLSQLDILRSAQDPDSARIALERVRDTLPAYAWIGFTDANGTVTASTGDVLRGVSIAARPVFKNGRNGLWIGDVHEAVMLAKLAPHAPGESVKFVDVAAPVYGNEGQFRGVLALHMSWQWAGQLRESLLKPRGGGEALRLTIVGKDGQVLLGSHNVAAAAPAAPNASAPAPLGLPLERLKPLEEHWASEQWRDGIESITAVAESRSQEDFAGFGWRVVARDNHGLTATQMAQARRAALGWSLGIGALCAVLACWLIGWLVAPVQQIAESLLTTDMPRKPGMVLKRRNDVQQIAAAVAHLKDTLRDRDEEVQSLERKAHCDPLTGLWNREFLAELAPRLLQAAAEQRMEVCVICIDLDGFKPINDHHGHEAGDQVLAQVAGRLREAGRQEDFVFRLGGDEFMMLLTCPLGEGKELSRVVAARVLHDMRRPLDYRTLNHLRVGCSLGAAQWPMHGQQLADVIRRADEALYIAKRNGRGHLRQYTPAVQDTPANDDGPQAAAA